MGMRLPLRGVADCRCQVLGIAVPVCSNFAVLQLEALLHSQSPPGDGGALLCDSAPLATPPAWETRTGVSAALWCGGRAGCTPAQQRGGGVQRARGCSSRLTSALASLPIQALSWDWPLSAIALRSHSPAPPVTGVSGGSTPE